MLNKYWKMFMNWIKPSNPSNDIEETNEIMTYKLKVDTNEIKEIQVETKEVVEEIKEIQVETKEVVEEIKEIQVEENKYYKSGVDELQMMEEPSLNDK